MVLVGTAEAVREMPPPQIAAHAILAEPLNQRRDGFGISKVLGGLGVILGVPAPRREDFGVSKTPGGLSALLDVASLIRVQELGYFAEHGEVVAARFAIQQAYL